MKHSSYPSFSLGQKATSLAIAIAMASLPGSSNAQSSTPVASNWIASGPGYASARSGNTIYIGGLFDVIGPSTGPGATFNRVSGEMNDGFPLVTGGTIDSCVAGGVGDWYIGGNFTHIEGAAQANLAHILADGTLDLSWTPLVDGGVREIVIDGNTLFVGGTFTQVDGLPHRSIVAFDTGTGNRLNWNPNLNGGVFTIAVSGSTVYIGGDFGQAGQAAREYIAAIDRASGLATPWDPQAEEEVLALVVTPSAIYAGGVFTNIGGQPRKFVAALDPVTGLALAFNAQSNNEVNDLALDGTVLYVGGAFNQIGGQQRRKLAALDSVTGSATSWDPSPDGSVHTLYLDGQELFVGGSFHVMAGVNRERVAAFDTTTGLVTSFGPAAGRVPNGFASQGSQLLVCGLFDTIGGVARQNLGAIDATTGMATAWNPGADSVVRTLEVSGGVVYVGGEFSELAGQQRNGIGAVDAVSGAVSAWNPDAGAGGSLSDLVLGNSSLYALGNFNSIGGAGRIDIAELDLTTGLATGWNVGSDSFDMRAAALSPDQSLLYVVGRFQNIGGAPRNNFAALDTGTGLAGALDAQVPSGKEVRCLELSTDGTTLYLGGSFTQIQGQSRVRLAAIDTASHGLTAFNPGADAYVTNVTLSVDSTKLYAGGLFTSFGGQVRRGLAGVEAATGVMLDWAPQVQNLTTTPFYLAVSSGSVYSGQRLQLDLEAPRQGFLEFRDDSTGTAFCFGDGSGSACPCVNGDPGAGCANSLTGGATLTATGDALFGNDSFGLTVSGIPGAKIGLAVKGSMQLGGGAGVLVGDGLLCTSPQLRSQAIVADASGDLTMSDWHGQSFGTYPGAANVGAATYYQWWYRDPQSNCSGSGFNFTNAWSVTWY